MTNLNNFEQKALDMLIDFLADNPEYDAWDDIHFDVYNSDYTYIYYRPAVDALEEYGVFDAIEKVAEYEKFNFGEVTTDFSDPVAVANMLIYITGEEILSKLDVFDIVNALWTNDEGDVERINNRILEVAREAA